MKKSPHTFVIACAAAALAATAAAPAAANCSGTTLWGYDASGHKIVTVSTDGNANVQTVVNLLPGVGQLEGIAWNEAGTLLYGLTQSGEAYAIDLASGGFYGGQTGQHDLSPGLTESSANLTWNDSGSFGRWASLVTDPNTPPLPTVYLRELDAISLPTTLSSGLTNDPLYIGGLDTFDCDYDDYFGLAAGDIGTIRVFHWSDDGFGFGWGQIDPVAIGGERVDAAAVSGGQIYTIGNIAGKMVRFAPRSGTFSAVIPQPLGSIGPSYDIRGLSFGPAPSGGSTTTSTTTTTTTTSSTTTTTIQQPQTRGQIGCIAGVNKAAAKLAKTRGQETNRCLKDRHAGKLANTTYSTLDLCIGADRRGKVTKAQAKLMAAEQKRCQAPNVPDYGYAGATLANLTHELAPRTLAVDLLGSPTETAGAAGAADKSVGACQRAVLAGATKLLDTKLSTFGRCKQTLLKSAAIFNMQGFAACLSALDVTSNPYGSKIAKAVASTTVKVDKACKTVVTGSALPGRCAGLTGSGLGDCVAASAGCEACLALTTTDAFSYDCDTFDDGQANSSCGP